MEFQMIWLVTTTVTAYTIYRLSVWLSARLSRPPYPPGPRGIPLLGNVLYPTENLHTAYLALGNTYGSDIIYSNVLGRNLVVLNSLQAATDLLDKRSAIYSCRPTDAMTMLYELADFTWFFGISPYNSGWRDSRKLFMREFSPAAITKYRPIFIDETHKMLRKLTSSPDKLLDHLRHLVSAQLVTVTYGIKAQGSDGLIASGERVMDAIDACMTPGAYLVDLLPILKHVPKWFPGAGFQRQAQTWKELSTPARDEPWEAVKDRMEKSGCIMDCVAESMLETVSKQDACEHMDIAARGAAAIAYIAGPDTTSAALGWFFVAMLLYPEVQKRAQKCIDDACKGRLPDYDDYDDMPYMHALVQETLRWKPASPINIPHRLTKDDVYRGYFIPEGSMVFANNWAILHDPSTYPSPEEFRPERFLTPGGMKLDPNVPFPMAGFGFGRRICPGRHLAYESIWIAVTSVLAVYDIAPAMDERGTPILPTVDAEVGFASHPKPFLCRITPRSPEAHAQLIRDTEN